MPKEDAQQAHIRFADTYEPLNAADVALIEREIARTGVGWGALSVRHASELPEGMTENVLRSWLLSAVASAPKGYVAWVIEKYAALPTEVEIEPETLHRWQEIRVRAALSRFFQGEDQAPYGLTAMQMQKVLDGQRPRMPETWRQWIDARVTALEQNDLTPEAWTRETVRYFKQEASRTGVPVATLFLRAVDVPAGLTAQTATRLVRGLEKRSSAAAVAWLKAAYARLPDVPRIKGKTDLRKSDLTHEELVLQRKRWAVNTRRARAKKRKAGPQEP